MLKRFVATFFFYKTFQKESEAAAVTWKSYLGSDCISS